MSIEKVKKIKFKFVQDSRGNLTEVELKRDIPFKPKRIFLVNDVPSSKIRGEHAHKECHQLLLCTNGSVSVSVDDGRTKKEYILSSINEGLYLPPMIWGIQYNYSKNAVLMVFASHEYDKDDYIRDYDIYLNEVKHHQH